jgi:hypothetical protein
VRERIGPCFANEHATKQKGDKMKPILKTMFAILVGLTLAACDSTHSPEAVIGSAAKALKENRIKDFRKLLIDEAKLEYQNLESVENLQSLLADQAELQIQSQQVLATTGSKFDYTETVQVLVASRGVEILDIEVKCRTSYGLVGDEPTSTTRRLGDIERPQRDWYTICRISEIR